MKSEEAKRMMDAARAEATKIGKGVSIAILDGGGLMMAFDRYNDAAGFTAVVAEAKASASVFMGRDSGALAAFATNAPAIMSAVSSRLQGRFAPHQGAVVIRNDAGVYGAIGVSGATSEEDEQIAKAGLAAL
ncbi:MAG TPA: heme-binding protein [Dehalococcoidia bacterium]|nr:heme-binding protein [Dehalococcoidia bacterium]